MFELEYDSVFGVYKVIIGDEVILTGTDDYQEAEEYAQELIEEGVWAMQELTYTMLGAAVGLNIFFWII